MKKLLILVFVFSSISGSNALNIDSLWSIWDDTSKPDTIRLEAIGIIAWEGYLFSKPDSAYYFAQLQYDFAKETSNSHFIAAALNTQGATRWMQSKYSSAIDHFLKSLEINEENGEEGAIASILNNIGLIYQQQGNLTESKKYYQKSLDKFEKLGFIYRTTGPLNNIGSIYKILGDYSIAMEYFNRAMKIGEEYEIKQAISISLNNLGEIYREMGEYNLAMQNFKRSLFIDEELKNKHGLTKTLNNIGLVYNSQKEYHEALGNYLISLEISEELGDKSGMAKTLILSGNIYEKQGELEKAMNYYQRSLETQKEVGDKQGIASSHINIANIYCKQERYIKSILHGDIGLSISVEMGLAKEIGDAANVLHKANKISGSQKKALEMHELYIVMRDSIVNKNNTRTLIEQDYKFKYDKEKAIKSAKHNKKMALSAERKKHQELISYGTSFGLLTLLVFVFVFNNRFQLTKKQKEIIKSKNRHITESIRYAKRIQEASLTDPDFLNEIFKDHFVFYQPKEIVSGDFYWAHKINNENIMIAVCDCTGHGVPGAFMSMVGNTLLNEVIIENKTMEIDNALSILNDQINITLKQDEENAQTIDGIDISLLLVNKSNGTIKFSGAGQNIIIANNSKLQKLKGDPYPLGYVSGEKRSYSCQEAKLEKGDIVYLFTDGFTQQYGGKSNQLYSENKFENLIKKSNQLAFEEQQLSFYRSFNNWKGGNNQNDDVCLIGFSI